MASILVLFLALLVGITLGLIGSGGGLLAVPIMVDLAGISPIQAGAYSLFIIGITSFVGAIAKFLKGKVVLKAVFLFALPSTIVTFLTRYAVVPNLPTHILGVPKGSFLMLLFGLVMVLAAISMIRNARKDRKAKALDPMQKEPAITLNIMPILIFGAIEGFISGLVGAGGGFLIVPALVLLARIPIHLATGTSLAIIAIKATIGFSGDLSAHFQPDWPFLLSFTAAAVVGIFLGMLISIRLSAQQLKPVFGYFVLLVALYVITKTVLQLFPA